MYAFHIHSHYSLFDGLSSPEEIVKKAKELNYKAISINDHDSIAGWPEFLISAKQYDILPILGVELYVRPESLLDYLDEKNIELQPHELTKLKKQLKYARSLHINLYVRNKDGIKAIYQLLSKTPDFKIPETNQTIRLFELLEICEVAKQFPSSLIVSTGCASSPFAKALTVVDDQKQFADKLLNALASDFSNNLKDGLVIELHRHLVGKSDETKTQKDLDLKKKEDLLYQYLAKDQLEKDNAQFCVIPAIDSHFVNENDMVAQVLKMQWFKAKITLSTKRRNDENLFVFGGGNYHILNEKQYYDAFNDIKDSYCEDFVNLFDKNINIADLAIDQPREINYNIYKIAQEKLNELKLNNDPAYQKRLNEEIELVKELKYESAIYSAYLAVDYLKNKLGYFTSPGRGSASGSLLLYLLGITAIDPIKHKLSRALFLSRYRTSPPDIDIEIPAIVQKQLREYLAKNYHFFAPAIFKTIGSAVAFSHTIAYPNAFNQEIAQEINKITQQSKIKWEKKPNEITDYDHILSMLMKNGLTKEHAEIISNTVITLAKSYCGIEPHVSGLLQFYEDSYVPKVIASVTESDINIFTYNSDLSEKIGMYKLDLLPLRTLTAINAVSKKTGLLPPSRTQNYNDDRIWKFIYNSIYQDDKVLNYVHHIGGQSVKNLIKKELLNTDKEPLEGKGKYCNVHALSVLLSLARPNVSKESIKLYLNKTPNKPSYMTEIEEINKILAPTNGAIVWQEQILNLLIAAKLTPTEAYKARKELAKDKQIDNKLLEKIRQNLKRFGSAGEELYETLAKGGYGFSKCHAVATALLALDCAWALITDENYYIKVLNEVVPKNTIEKKAENKPENTQEAKNENKEINEYELKSIYLGNIPSGNIIEDKFRTYVLGL